MKRLTIKEIAQMAGVSVTAVSFVLNNKPGVSEETRQHVQKIIDETGFKPNLNSKKLLFNKSFNICVMINSQASPFEDLFYYEITRGILNKSREYGYNISINEPIHANHDLPDMVYTGDTDGIIFMQDLPDTLSEKVFKCGVPFVVVDSHILSDAVTSINPDYRSATHTATTYLLQNDHRRIGIIPSKVVPVFREQTMDGFRSALQEYGLAPEDTLITHGVRTEQEAYEAAKTLLELPNRPSAIVCTVDMFAIGAMQCAKDLGLKIPQDLSIVGIDDILLSRYTEPKLTTVGIDKVHMGELAMDLLLKKIKGKKPRSVSLPMELVVRDSVKKLDT